MRVAIPGGVWRFVACLMLFLCGCGPSFDPPSELHALRVLAVQKDLPYAQPSESDAAKVTVHLKLLWQDASPEAGRPIQIAWSPPCVDPVGDLYYACFKDFSGEPSTTSPALLPQYGDTATFDVPSDIISRKPAPSQPWNAPYGIAYLFFGVCAGTLEFVPPTTETAFPVVCKGQDGQLLGPDDFVAGYTSVYAYQGFSNQNPVISGFELNGQALAGSQFCLAEDCLAQDGSVLPSEIPCDDPANRDPRCVPTCADDGDPKCPGHDLRPTLDMANPANQEEDSVSAALLGRHVGEQMWINYYTGGGSFKSPVRLLNDATSGWNDQYGTKFYAPKLPGPFRVWAVVHDNRGGAAWVGVTLQAY
jgi:hypothetical protein